MTATLAPLTGKAQRSVHLATARLNVWEGSVRSGKTVASILAWLLFVRTGPAGNLVMVGKTERTLKRNIIDPLTDWLGPKRCRYVQGSGELWLLGRRIYVAGANDERAQDKIRGLTLVGAYVDEASVIPESFWSMLLTRLSADGARLFATTNPDAPTHWLMDPPDRSDSGYLSRARLWIRHDGEVIETDSKLDLHRFSFRLADNPTLSADYIAALEAEFSGLWRKRFIEGLWVLAEGAVYDAWDEERHVVSTIPGDVAEVHVAVDDGTAGVFAAQLLALTDRAVVVARELRWSAKDRGRQLTDGQKSERVRDWLDQVATGADGNPAIPAAARPARVHVDPSATSLIRQFDLDGLPAVRARNDVRDGIQYCSSLLALGRLLVHESCRGLRAEIPGYVWDPKAAERGQDRPVKANDHHCDATRYGVVGTASWWWGWLSVPDREQVAA